MRLAFEVRTHRAFSIGRQRIWICLENRSSSGLAAFWLRIGAGMGYFMISATSDL